VLLSRSHATAIEGLLAEVLALAALFVVIVWTAARLQDVTIIRLWDSEEYSDMTEQMAAGQVPHAAAPYVYRLATPWLVARLWPAQIVTGFRVVNLSAAAATTLLLLVWLRRFVAMRWARLVAVTLFLTEWHGPARFISYYPVYVDPLVFPFLIAGLILVDSIRLRAEGDDGALLAVLTAVCVLGVLCREVMIVIPISLLCVRRQTRLCIPLVATVAVIAATRLVTQPRLAFSFIGASLFQLNNKPVYTWVLAWFITFGPVLTLVFYDWRNVWRTLGERRYLASYLALFAVLAYVGGSDTERLLFWSMPVMYLLIAQAFVNHRHALANTYLAAALVVAQAVSARIFWSIPSPSLAVAAWSDMPAGAARLYAVLNRLVVIDDFHWNLWSNFGSRPFHALLLAIYLAFAAALIAAIHLRTIRLHRTNQNL
jgi:hypothetical protein